ncbi:cell wall protein Ecm33 [Exophiala oligosperma]
MQLLNEPPTQSMLQKLKVTHHVRPSSRHTPVQAEEVDTFEETVLLWVHHSWLRRLVVDERQRTPSHPPSLMIHVSEHNEAGHNLDLHDVLGNLSFSALTQIGGGFSISPITTLSRQVITGFPRAPRPSCQHAIPQLMSVVGSNVPDNVQITSTNTTICDLFNQAHTLLVVIKGVNTRLTNKAHPVTSPLNINNNPYLNLNGIKMQAVSTMDVNNNNLYLASIKDVLRPRQLHEHAYPGGCPYCP